MAKLELQDEIQLVIEFMKKKTYLYFSSLVFSCNVTIEYILEIK